LTGDLKNWLYSAQGREYLDEKYNRDGLSLREIASPLNTNPVAISRAMAAHRIPRRDRAEAQKTALEKGRADPPVRGPRPEAHKVAIGRGVKRAWKDGRYDRALQSERGRRRWGELGPDGQREFVRKGFEAFKEKGPSELRAAVAAAVKGAFPDAAEGAEEYLGGHELRLDLWVPSLKCLVEVLGPADLHPIFGEEPFARQSERSRTRWAAVLEGGGRVVLVRNDKREPGLADTAEACEKVLEALKNLPLSLDRVIEIEVE
jgi:hypothetical protein